LATTGVDFQDKSKGAKFLLRAFFVFAANFFCPEGTTENSPQFQLRVKAVRQIKPRRGGRKNYCGKFCRPCGACGFLSRQTRS
jgi:hypothetical protein